MYKIVMNDGKEFKTEKLTIQFLNLINPIKIVEVYKDNQKLNIFVFLKKVENVFRKVDCHLKIQGCLTCNSKKCTLRNGI